MEGFLIRTKDNTIIRFRLYTELAPFTCDAFLQHLPFTRVFFHARVSGEEVWTDDAPRLLVPQEHVTVFAEPGEIAIGPIQPSRNKVAGMMGIFYGEGKLVDGSNLFGKVTDEDFTLLQRLGDNIWKEGARDLKFEKLI